MLEIDENGVTGAAYTELGVQKPQQKYRTTKSTSYWIVHSCFLSRGRTDRFCFREL